MTSEVAELLVSLWGWLELGIGLVCVYLVYWGLRARRLGEHPHCRRCMYDLTGQPMDSRQCPECGLDVTAAGNVVRGRTRREWKWVGWAIVIAVIAVGANHLVWPMVLEAKGRWARLSQTMKTGDIKAASAILQQDPGLLDTPGRANSLLMLAIRSRNDAAVAMLLEDPQVKARVKTAEVNAKNNDDQTPLMFAAMSDPSPEAISTLVRAGADVNAKKNPKPEIIAALVKAGADVNAKDIGGKSVLDWGRQNRNKEVLAELIKAGAK